LFRGMLASANPDPGLSNGFYYLDYSGQYSESILVFNPGGSCGTVQMRFNYQGQMWYRNKTDNASWTGWKEVAQAGGASAGASGVANHSGRTDPTPYPVLWSPAGAGGYQPTYSCSGVQIRSDQGEIIANRITASFDMTNGGASAGDLVSKRAANTGVVYFGNVANGKYLYFDGTIFSLNGGNLTCSGDVTAFSDARVKRNIEVIPEALYKVSKLRGVTFTRTDTDDDKKRHAGVIAQEVEMVLPEVVSELKKDINGKEINMKQVAYGNMVGLLIEAIKELTTLNTRLTDKVEVMETLLKEKGIL